MTFRGNNTKADLVTVIRCKTHTVIGIWLCAKLIGWLKNMLFAIFTCESVNNHRKRSAGGYAFFEKDQLSLVYNMNVLLTVSLIVNAFNAVDVA